MTTPSISARSRRSRDRLTEILARSAGVTRAQLAAETGLAPSSVAATIADLIAEGVVAEEAVSLDAHGRGRRPVLLVLAPRTSHVVGLDIGHRHVAVAVADQDGTILAEHREPIDVDHNPGSTLDLAARSVRAAVRSAGLAPAEIEHVNACLPSILDVAPEGGDALSWQQVRADLVLGHHLGREVRIVHDAAAGLAGELRFGAARGVRDLVYVKAADGIGAALLLDGRLHRGRNGLAGEIGHVRVAPALAGESAHWCRCGNQGCLETVVSIDEIDRRLARLGHARVDDQGPEVNTVVTRMMVESGRVLGRVLADLCTTVDPAVVVVGGQLALWAVEDGRSPLVAGIQEALGQYGLPAVTSSLDVRPAELGCRSELMGTIALGLNRTATAPR